ncbi:MFS transporter [Erwinia sp. JUb26]|uniref:MFS transporter n=1 Tax=Erwinia sp. JUb26 TaxID=2485126 RepID=UPI000F461DB6|nr:MFS transporter [Erwinia sp. JUb26]ROR10043.1 putative MFS family arabinose efflux permease [Erwinia sp. JUb26]
MSSETTAFIERDRLPVSALLALALAGFITILTEALPAGLLPQISSSLSVSTASAGQLVTLYALGSLLAAIPLTIATQSLRRRPLLLTAVSGFIVANTVTALSGDYLLTLAARFLAGVSAGLLWALIAGYAARMVHPSLKGRAISLAMVGTPLALSIGIPLGTFISEIIGWRSCFMAISALSLLLMLWIVISVPDFAAQPAAKRLPLSGVLHLPGVRSVLAATLIFVLAHNILYTYIAPFLQAVQMADRISTVLLVFGIASLLGIWLVGLTIDRWLRLGALLSTLLFALAMVLLEYGGGSPTAIYAAVILWGLAFGGAPSLFQTALAKTADGSADVAQSMLVTAWNIAIAGGGAAGAAILSGFGPGLFAPTLIALLAVTGWTIWRAKSHGFRTERGN